MSGPPPPSSAARDESLRAQWVAELRALDTPELLALCLTVHGSGERLRLYLSLFRSRAGPRAQLAACLVCFDLSSQGDALAQREFTALAPTMIALAAEESLVAGLLGADPYLLQNWAACRDALAAADPRGDHRAFETDAEVVGELDLLSDDDLDLGDVLEASLENEVARRAAAQQAYGALLADYLGQDPAAGRYSGEGFATATGRDLDALEAFLQETTAHASLAPSAAGMASLGNLYLAVHLRARTLFGRPNPRRRAALREGLLALPADGAAAALAAGGFELAGASTRLGFEKVLELLMDFVVFCGQRHLLPGSAEAATQYVEAERQPPPLLLTPGGSRRRRG